MTDEPKPSPTPEPAPIETPSPSASPFEPPPLDSEKRGYGDDEEPREVVRGLDGSPFETPPIEGLPFDRGSDEDKAIRRVIERSTQS